jgi:steroid delta-isomerase-like uncharacterized protein
MTPEEMKKLHDEHLAAEDRKDLETVMATYHDDCFHETIATGMKFVGKDAVRAQYQAAWAAFPEASPVQLAEAFGDNVLMDRNIFRGKMAGPLYGFAPTGRDVTLPFGRAVLFKDGLIYAEIGYFDLATLCEQAGIPLDEARVITKRLADSLASAPSATRSA